MSDITTFLFLHTMKTAAKATPTERMMKTDNKTPTITPVPADDVPELSKEKFKHISLL